MALTLSNETPTESLVGVRDQLGALGECLPFRVAGMAREEALDLAERVEDVARQVAALQLVAAQAVRLAAPDRPGACVLVDHHGERPVAPTRDPGAVEDPLECEHAADESPLTPVDDGRSPFRRATDLLRVRLRISGHEARRRVRAAELTSEQVTTSGEILPPARPHVAAALTQVDPEAADEILRVVERVASLEGVADDDVERVEATLIEHALTFDVDDLRRIGRHAVAVMDPDGAEPDQHEARTRQGVHIGRLYRGLATVRLVVDAAQLETLQTVLDVGTNPRVRRPLDTTRSVAGAGNGRDGSGAVDGRTVTGGTATGGTAAAGSQAEGAGERGTDARTRAQRQLDALVAALVAALRVGELPHTGGSATQLTVTIDYRDLVGSSGGAGAVDLPHAGPVPVRSVRHLLCDADIVPVVLGHGRKVLTLGQTRRLVPPWMRPALVARDGPHCAFPGCTIPASWTEAHHITPWHAGGETSVDNSVLLCGYHHKLADRGVLAIHQARPGASPQITPAH